METDSFMKMKTSALFTFSLLLLISPATAVEVDAIAAKVNSDVILKSDVVSEMKHSRNPSDNFADVRNEMVERKLILKAAAEAKMAMQEWVVESRVREIVQRAFDGDRNRLLETLAREKVSYTEWYQRLKDDMVVSAMRWQIVEKNCNPSPAALREEYEKHPERYAEDRKVTVSVILLRPEDAEKREEVQDALKEEPFADVARRYSSDAHSGEGGLWKDVTPDEVFRKEVCEEIAKMPKGTLSPWIDLEGWSFLIRKDDEKTARTKTFAEAFPEIEANVKDAMAERIYKEWVDRLKAEAFIKVYE